MMQQAKHVDIREEHADTINPAGVDLSKLNKKEREVLVEYMGGPHTGLAPHRYDSVDLAKSDGEKLFDVITYKGLAWLGTAALGIYLSHEFKDGHGKELFAKAADNIAPYYQKLTGASEKVSREATQSGLVHAGLITGGSIPVYPVKRLEDNKAQIVAMLDQKINERRIRNGDAPTEDELAVQKQTQERLKNTPNQSWGSLLGGRIAGVSSVFFTAIFLARGKDKKILEKVAKEITPNEKLQSLGVITALDLGYSFVSEEVLYYTSHMLNSLSHRRGSIMRAQSTEQPSAQTSPDSHINHVMVAANQRAELAMEVST